MKENLSSLQWNLTGYIPFEWELGKCVEIGVDTKLDVDAVPVCVPSSVQKALRDANVISDWNYGADTRALDWIENRHWVYQTALPKRWFKDGSRYRLRCRGLDYKGGIYINGKCAYRFDNCHTEHCFEITPYLGQDDNKLQILFECPPRWLGQFGYSSRIRDWKPRFYYTWDWVSRVVQIGVWDDIFVERIPACEITDVFVHTDYDAAAQRGAIAVRGAAEPQSDCDVQMRLYDDKGGVILSKRAAAKEFNRAGFNLEGLAVSPWMPNNCGSQTLYRLELSLINNGEESGQYEAFVGFKRIQWLDCLDAPSEAAPWLCNINGRNVFLQGVNWTPIRPNFADVTYEQYRKRLELYKSIGINTLRVWGGYTREKSCFYDICDELGLLVWQDMPLSSSGIENYPPDDEQAVGRYLEVVRAYVSLLHHHVCILLWSGGNELTAAGGKPLGYEHPMFGAAKELIGGIDFAHRFVPTTPWGPCFTAAAENFGKGLHWDVHGPWKAEADLDAKWHSYWDNDDALFRSEVGAPGPSDARLITKYAAGRDTYPDAANPLWRRTGWWLEMEQYINENGEKPQTLEDYVQWGQQRQADILCKAVKSCKDRFPRCGGIILWMGHDCFPCTANTSIMDFEGNLKPAAIKLAGIFSA